MSASVEGAWCLVPYLCRGRWSREQPPRNGSLQGRGRGGARRQRKPVPQGRFIDLGRSDITGAPNAFNYNTLLPNKSDLSLPRARQLWRIAFNSRDPDIFYDRIMHYSLFLSFLYLAQSLRATGGCYTQCSPRNVSRLSRGAREVYITSACERTVITRWGGKGESTFVCTLDARLLMPLRRRPACCPYLCTRLSDRHPANSTR